MALLAAMGRRRSRRSVADFDADVDDLDDAVRLPRPPRRTCGELLRDAAGGDDALRALDDRPLPDEDFDWSGIAETSTTRSPRCSS